MRSSGSWHLFMLHWQYYYSIHLNNAINLTKIQRSLSEPSRAKTGVSKNIYDFVTKWNFDRKFINVGCKEMLAPTVPAPSLCLVDSDHLQIFRFHFCDLVYLIDDSRHRKHVMTSDKGINLFRKNKKKLKNQLSPLFILNEISAFLCRALLACSPFEAFSLHQPLRNSNTIFSLALGWIVEGIGSSAKNNSRR